MKPSTRYLVVAVMAAGSVPASAHAQWPSPRQGHVLVYDAARRESVLLGGDTDSPSQTRDSVWAWSGRAWRVSAAEGPIWRTLPSAAFDSRRGRVVVHGGVAKLGQRQYRGTERDTWEWDGTRWTRTVESGPAIDHAVMVYDEARGVMVMQGGGSEGRILDGTTWTYDGTAWSVAADSASGPGPRVHHAAAYDSRRGRVVLFGGFGPGNFRPSDTWEWDGARWQRVATEGPGALSRHRMAYDAERGVVILFGGSDDTRTWAWDGQTWRVVATAGPARQMSAMTWDADRRRIIMFSGSTNEPDLWEWNGLEWRQVSR